MAVKINIIKQRPDDNINFNVYMTDLAISKFSQIQDKMESEGKIISLTEEYTDDELIDIQTIVFNNAESMFEYFFFYEKDIDLAQDLYDNNLYFIEHNIKVTYDIDWNYTP